MAKPLRVVPWIAAIAIGSAWLSTSAQTNAPLGSSNLPPAVEQDSNASSQSAPVSQEPEVLQPDLLGTIESQFQPDPSSGMMTIDFVVTDQQGRSVGGLGEKDFTLLDNGEPRNIVTFQAFDSAAFEPAPTVKVILVIDEVNAPEHLRRAAEQSAEKFLLQNGGHLAQPTMVYRISDDGLFASAQPSKDGIALAEEVAQRKEPRTIWKSKDLLQSDRRASFEGELNSYRTPHWIDLPHPLIALGAIAVEERRTPEKKLLFWIGHGWPAEERQREPLSDTVIELSTRLREARVGLWVDDFWGKEGSQASSSRPIYCLWRDFRSFIGTGQPCIQVLAVQSGGGVLQGQGDAAELISREIEKANTFYTLTFDPPRTDVVDEYRSLSVSVGKPGLTAHTRTGYYNQPVYHDQARADVMHVTVAELRESLHDLQNASDSQAERHLQGMELTERFPSSDLAKWLKTLKGPKAKQALIAIVDQSVFYSPPSEATLNEPPPSLAEQHNMIQRTVGYVSKTIPLLPNLIADRTTTLYTEPPRPGGQTWKIPTGDHYLEPARIAKAELHVSGGKESAHELNVSSIRKVPESKWLRTEGTFGPILASVLVAVSKPQSKLLWARWEKSDKDRLAVFRYYIPKDTPIFKAGFCCMAVDSNRVSFEIHAPSQGEIAIDPTTGVILRFTLRAALAWRLPLQRADVMVEYGPVNLGEKSYFCPIRSVSISRPRSVTQVSAFGEIYKVYAPFETLLNHMEYTNYHLFGSTSRVLPGFIPPS
jgi:VWFA-related protein